MHVIALQHAQTCSGDCPAAVNRAVTNLSTFFHQNALMRMHALLTLRRAHRED